MQMGQASSLASTSVASPNTASTDGISALASPLPTSGDENDDAEDDEAEENMGGGGAVVANEKGENSEKEDEGGGGTPLFVVGKIDEKEEVGSGAVVPEGNFATPRTFPVFSFL